MLVEKVKRLKERMKAVVLVHNYQPPDIQDLADYVGDSLELSKAAAATDAEVIIFCGVNFMAETAKILSPDKKVILPVEDATCPMADMITAEDLIKLKMKHVGVPVVSYVNTTADVKAQSDICCTSSNAIKIVNSIMEDTVVFTPDRNLADYVSTKVEKIIIPWQGFCPIHDVITKDDVEAKRREYPEALFIAHPECRPEVLKMADSVASTGQMFEVVEKSDRKVVIVGTEEGMVYPLKRRFAQIKFIPAKSNNHCKNMKKMTVEKVVAAMESGTPEIILEEEIINRARMALERMLNLS